MDAIERIIRGIDDQMKMYFQIYDISSEEIEEKMKRGGQDEAEALAILNLENKWKKAKGERGYKTEKELLKKGSILGLMEAIWRYLHENPPDGGEPITRKAFHQGCDISCGTLEKH